MKLLVGVLSILLFVIKIAAMLGGNKECLDRCGEVIAHTADFTCQCDWFCGATGDCCTDFEPSCPSEWDIAQSVHYMESRHISSSSLLEIIIDKCPPGFNQSEEIVSFCDTPNIVPSSDEEAIDKYILARLPVYHETHRVYFYNVYCAFCWGLWSPEELLFAEINAEKGAQKTWTEVIEAVKSGKIIISQFELSASSRNSRKKLKKLSIANCVGKDICLLKYVRILDKHCVYNTSHIFDPVGIVTDTSELDASSSVNNGVCFVKNTECLTEFEELNSTKSFDPGCGGEGYSIKVLESNLQELAVSRDFDTRDAWFSFGRLFLVDGIEIREDNHGVLNLDSIVLTMKGCELNETNYLHCDEQSTDEESTSRNQSLETLYTCLMMIFVINLY